MEDKKISDQINQVLKKSRGEPAKLMELILCIWEMNDEGRAASYPGIVRKMWPEEWNQARDKVKFEKTKWDLLCKRRREINARIFTSNFCFNFYIELSPEKQFEIQTSPEDIRIQRQKELEWNLARERSKSRKEKIIEEIVELNNKFRDFEKEDSEEVESEGAKVKNGLSDVASEVEGKGPNRKLWIAFALLTIFVLIAVGVMLKSSYFRSNPQNSELSPAQSPSLETPDKPSIAVLPFVNISGDPEQDYIGDGLSENIISALSISSQIFVIARNSTFTYKGKPVKVQQIAEELGVQYVMEGSIQKSGERLRVTVQLIDALKGYHLWSDMFDREMKEIFDLQDEITKKIAKSIVAELHPIGDDIWVTETPTDNLEAWKHVVKGGDLFVKYNAVDNSKSREHFKVALKLDPQYVEALVMLGWTHLTDVSLRWSGSPFMSVNSAFELAQKALKIDEKYAGVHSLLGYTYLFQRQYDEAITEGKMALTIAPNFSLGHQSLAVTMFYSGHFDEAVTLLKKALRLNPNLLKLNPFVLNWLRRSYWHLGRYEEALEVCYQIREFAINGRTPSWYSPFGFSFVYVKLGRDEEARTYMAEALKVNPNLSLKMFKDPLFKNPDHLQQELDALRKAGMPEKAPEGVQ